MTKGTKSYAEQINDVGVMSIGLTNNAQDVATRGWDANRTAKFKGLLKTAIDFNGEQEKLKADLKQKTAELDAVMSDINIMLSEARKIVKLQFPQEKWKEFGIQAKK